jgi:hypothetical protein
MIKTDPVPDPTLSKQQSPDLENIYTVVQRAILLIIMNKKLRV